MKKLILTGCAVALFGISAMAQQVQDTTSTNNNLRQGVQQTEEEMNNAGNEIQQGAEPANDKINQNSPSANENPSTGATGTQWAADPAASQTEIEVLEGKEGPNNQVVYKYQGELYYVDRNEEKLVKIEESQLKDAQHKAIVLDKKSEKQ